MRNVLGFCVVSLAVACAGPEHSEGETFQTTDAVYELGEHEGVNGELVSVEVVEDTAVSYLTPQSPSSSWIVDRAVAHSQERPLLLNQVTPLGLYVRRCQGNHWINANETVFAPTGDLLQGTYDGQYVLAHYYTNILTNVFLDDEFECAGDDQPSLTTVTVDGQEQQVRRVGAVTFAYVVEHHQ